MKPIPVLFAGALIFAFQGPASAAGLADAPPGASSCSGCHPSGRLDTSVPRLAVSADAGYRWVRLPFPGFKLGGPVFSLSAHWYVK